MVSEIFCKCRLLIMLAKCGDHSHKYLRRCSLQCSIRVTYCAQGLDSAIRHSMKLLRANKSPRDRQAPTPKHCLIFYNAMQSPEAVLLQTPG